ncbi:hypothetical protein Tco_1363113 [Tanacetum coccineum]
MMGRLPEYYRKTRWFLLVDIKDHSFSSNSKIELFLFNSNNCISSVKKGSSQDERNFAIFHFENNEIDRKGLRVSRDSFAYKEYGIRLMLALRSARALHEKVLKLHGIRKLPWSPSFGGTLFWIILGIPAKTSTRGVEDIGSLVCMVLVTEFLSLVLEVEFLVVDLPLLVKWHSHAHYEIAVVDKLLTYVLLGLVEYCLEEIEKVDQIACQRVCRT